MAGVALVVSGRRILRGVVIWAVSAIVLLLIVTLLLFLSVASRESPLRWRGILVRVSLLLVIWNEGHVLPREPLSPIHAKGGEDREYDHENGDCDNNTCSGAQSFSANDITETDEGGQLRPG